MITLAFWPTPPSLPSHLFPLLYFSFFLFFRGTLSNLFGIITSNESNEKTRWWVEGGGGVVRTLVYCFSHLKLKIPSETERFVSDYAKIIAHLGGGGVSNVM